MRPFSSKAAAVKLFVAVILVGVALVLGGHSTVTIGLHSEQMASITNLVRGAVYLIAGTVFFCSGMLGLADAYEKRVDLIVPLFSSKQTEGVRSVVSSQASLRHQNSLFWQAYKMTAASILLFITGTSGLTFPLQLHSPIGYLVGLVIAALLLGGTTVIMVFRGTRSMHRAHIEIANAMDVLERQPDCIAEPASQKSVIQPTYEVFHRGPVFARTMTTNRRR